MNDREQQRLEQRIRERAYRLWEEEGRPEGRADVHWDKATELVAIEENLHFATQRLPDPNDFGPTGEPVEPLVAVENQGEFPTITDQGEEQPYPTRKRRRA